MARPTVYTEAIGLEICQLIARGMPLTKIVRREDMPCEATVYNWLRDKNIPEFLETYELARQDQADTLADEILEIADDGTNDSYKDEDGNIRTNNDVVQRSRLRVDARKWVAAKLKPKKYGDSIKQDVTMQGGERPVKIIAVEGFKGFGDDQQEAVDEQKDEENP